MYRNFLANKAIFSNTASSLHAPFTHGGEGQPPWVTLRDVIGDLPSLDAQKSVLINSIPITVYQAGMTNNTFWMKHTPEGQTAFDNSTCMAYPYREGSPHTNYLQIMWPTFTRSTDENLWVSKIGKRFSFLIPRMWWDKPLRYHLTMNSGVISSDLKGHPEQNRVLSLREIMKLSTLDHERWERRYDFSAVPLGKWDKTGRFSPRLVREVIGESIPPLAMEKIVNHLISLEALYR